MIIRDSRCNLHIDVQETYQGHVSLVPHAVLSIVQPYKGRLLLLLSHFIDEDIEAQILRTFPEVRGEDVQELACGPRQLSPLPGPVGVTRRDLSIASRNFF